MKITHPSISVIVPTHNRSSVVEKCLDALSRQTLSADCFEVIISDDGSTDNLREKIEIIRSKSHLHIRYLRQKNSGANAARNKAILESQGNLLLIINFDSGICVAWMISFGVLMDSIANESCSLIRDDRYSAIILGPSGNMR